MSAFPASRPPRRRYVPGRGAEADGALNRGAAPLDVLFEAAGLPAADLPEPLARLYGGPLGFEEPRVVANFVETIDGVVAIPSLPRSNRVVSGDSAEDRFVMGLLRAFADAVVVGSGTLAGAPRGIWTPEAAHPAGAGAFAELRARLGKPPLPELAVLTATGAVAPGHRAVEAGLLVVTNDQGAERLRGTLPRASEIVSLGADRHVDPRAALDLLRSRGHRLILAEAGPHLFGSLLEARLVDELFLTVSPLIAGRAGLDGRLALVEEAHLVPETPVDGRLLSVRRSGSHLFLRYEL